MAQIVTITNPLTGQPTQVDQLDHTAQQIDDGLNIARNVSNPNLLDNPYFGNPVDQRQGRVVKPNTTYYSDNTLATAAGTTNAYVTAYRYATGTANGVNYASFKLTDSDTAPTYYAAPENVVRGYTGAGYGIDRWILQAVTSCYMLVGDGYITLYAKNNEGLLQKFPAEKFSIGDTITVSVLTDTELLSKTITLTESVQVYPYDNSIWYISAGKVDGKWYVWPLITYEQSTVQSINVRATKLELGSQQTLAHQENGVWVLNEIPDYGEQLARCQRYSEKFLFCNGEGPSPVGVRFQNAIGKDADLVTIGAYIYFATQKRTVPVVRIEYDIMDGPTQTATVNWVDERCFSSTNIVVPAGQFIDIHWYEAIADL